MRKAIRSNPGRRQVAAPRALVPPTEGWDTSEALAAMKPKRALVLDNMFPHAEYVELRKGCKRHADSETGAPGESLMPYHGPGGSRLFVASDGAIYDVTDTGSAGAAVWDGLDSTRLQHVNFTTSGGSFLWCCNGADKPIFYDGSVFDEAVITFTGYEDAAPEDIIGVDAYKGRLWLVMKDQTYVAYLGVDSIQGAAETYELGGEMTAGGSVMAVATWSRDGGAGPDDYLVFVTTKGQVIVFAGTDPSSAATWAKVGTYQIGEPIGRRCLRKVGGDLAVICVDGVIPLSSMVEDRATAPKTALTGRIRRAQNAAAVTHRNKFGWEFTVHASATMALLNIPVVEYQTYEQYVVNTLTGAWCRFTGWNAVSFAVFQDRLFFADGIGRVYEANVGTQDVTAPIVGDMQLAFSALGSSGLKQVTMIQPFLTVDGFIVPKIAIDVDFRHGRAAPYPVAYDGGGSKWGVLTWGVDTWGFEEAPQTAWVNADAIGQTISVRVTVEVERLFPAFFWDETSWDEYNWDEGVDQGFVLRVNGFNVLAQAGGILGGSTG